MKRLIVTAAACAASVLGQDIRGTVGAAVFADDSAQVHRSFAGSFRFHLTPRFAIEPEISYLSLDDNHYDVVFIPHLTFDFRSLDKRVVPYVIGGVGYIRTVDHFGARRFTSQSAIAEGGFGTKIYLSRRVFVSPEVRVGSELHVRGTVSIGYTFGR